MPDWKVSDQVWNWADGNQKGGKFMDGYPVIRFTMEGMKHTVLQALQEHNLAMDEYVKEAINKVMTQENITAIVRETIAKEMRLALVGDIESFFKYGEGHKIVREAAHAFLRKWSDEKVGK